ncbi:hypothetical protein OG21DRAFT_1411113, partial [Imleria badia]
YEAGTTPSRIFDFDQLAMRLAKYAWNEVDATTIQTCRHKANILPDTDSSSGLPHYPVSTPLSPPCP